MLTCSLAHREADAATGTQKPSISAKTFHHASTHQSSRRSSSAEEFASREPPHAPPSTARVPPAVAVSSPPAAPPPPAPPPPAPPPAPTSAAGAEAVRQAGREGLTLVTSCNSNSGYKDVSRRASRKYKLHVWEGGKDVHLGVFGTAEEAALFSIRQAELSAINDS